jgi:redox-sensitive bicupin YhaK (pirin superfamily)
MTAGSGIMHQEMPKGDCRPHASSSRGKPAVGAEDDLPAIRHKSGDIPEVVDDDGTKVRTVVGDRGKRGPVEGTAAPGRYIDERAPRSKVLPVEVDRHAFAYVFAGLAISRRVETLRRSPNAMP